MTRSPVRAATRLLAPFLLLAACVSWWRPPASDELASGRAAGADRSLRLFLTGEMAGFLAPCGCEAGQYGGLARRGAYLRAVRRPGDLTIDLGNLAASDDATRLLTLGAALEGLRALDYDAFVPSEGEVLLGKDFEDEARRRPGLRVICANLLRADGTLVFEPWFVHTIPDGRRVAVVGVIEPFADVPEGYAVAPIEESLRAAMVALESAADAVVVAGGLRTDTTQTLAAKFPEAALVAGGWPTVGSKRIVETAGAPAMLVGEFGWYVGRVDFDDSLRVADSWQSWIDERLPDDPVLAGVVARYKASASQEGAGFAAKLLTSLREQGFAGSAACAECHAAEFEVWKASGHAHAMQTLVHKGSERDPSCIACHLQDVHVDPVVTADPLTFGLGCEGCHGGAARHADLARRGSSDAKSALAPATREACLRCHSPPNDTHFDFGHHWPKIAHGPGVKK